MNTTKIGITAIIGLIAVANIASVANGQESFSFTLEGSHQEDTVSETLEAVGFNVTNFEPQFNATTNQTIILVEGVKA
jgi:hypothetical protein